MEGAMVGAMVGTMVGAMVGPPSEDTPGGWRLQAGLAYCRT